MNKTVWSLESMKNWTEEYVESLEEVLKDLEGSRVTGIIYSEVTHLLVVYKLGGYSYSIFFDDEPNHKYRVDINKGEVSWDLPVLLIMEQFNEDILRYAKEHLGFDDKLKCWDQCIELVLKEAGR